MALNEATGGMTRRRCANAAAVRASPAVAMRAMAIALCCCATGIATAAWAADVTTVAGVGEVTMAAGVGEVAMAAGVPSAPNAIAIVLANPGFEAKPSDSAPAEGWDWSVHGTPSAYIFELDREVRHAGKASLRMRRTGSEPWGMMHQSLPAAGLTGRTLEFSAWLRTDRVDGEGAVLVMRTLANGAVDKVVFMSPAVTGSRDWKRYTIRFAMPRVASVVEVGAMLQGDGTLWLDDAALVVLP